MKKLLSVILAVLMMFSVVALTVGAAFDPEGNWVPENSTWAAIPKGDNVVARFAIGADIHCGGGDVYSAEKLTNAYKALEQIGGVDAFMIAGDLTDAGNTSDYVELMEVVNKYTQNNPINPNATGNSVPVTIMSMGNHEYGNYLHDPVNSYLAERLFTEYTSQQTDALYNVAGVPVIALSPDPVPTDDPDSVEQGLNYDASYDELRNFYAQIDADSRYGNGSTYQGPVIIIAHHRLNKSVSWADNILDLMEAHGGTIVFTGHSHTWFYNTNYFIHQNKGITDVRVGTLGVNYGGVDGGWINAVTGKSTEPFETDESTNSSLVLVDVMSDGTTKVRRLDLAKGKEMFADEDFIITPGDHDDFIYQKLYPTKFADTKASTADGYAQGSQAPSFPEGAAVTVEDVGNSSSIIVKFPEATAATSLAKDFVMEYRIQIYNSETNTYVMNGKYDYFRVGNYRKTADEGKDWEVIIHGLSWDTDYEVSVTALTSYSVKSETIKSQTRVNVGHAVLQYPATPVVDFDYTYGQLFDKTGGAMTMTAATYQSRNITGLGKKAVRVYPSSSVFAYEFDEDDFRTICNGFTLEAYFMPGEVGQEQMVAGSVSVANMALKIKGGQIGLWAKFGTTPTGSELNHVNTSITAKEWVHIVVTYDGKQLCLYKDGILVDSTTENIAGGLNIGGGNAPEDATPEEAAQYPDGFFVGAGGIMDSTGKIPDQTLSPASYINKVTLYQGIMTADDVKVAHKIATSPAIPFTDVIEKYTVATFGEWIVDSVEYAYSTGLVNGMTDTTFGPDSVMTRAQFVKMLYNFEKMPAVTVTNQFSDVTADKWFADAVSWAYANGLVNGRTPTTFAPDEPINRQEAATLIYRYYKNFKNGTELEVSDEAKANYNAKYVDAGSVGDFAVEAMHWANAYGIVNGTSETTLSPQNVATRAQVTKLFVGFVKKFAPPTIV